MFATHAWVGRHGSFTLMDNFFVNLRAHQLHRLNGPASVRAESGLLWVTVDGELEDILLAAGESRCIDRPGATVIVYALGGAASFEARSCGGGRRDVQAAPLWARITSWLRSARPAWGGST